MSLIICPECHKEVSNTCEVCFHCGFDLRKREIFNQLDDLDVVATFLKRSIATPIVSVSVAYTIVTSMIITFYYINWTVMWFFIVLDIVYFIMMPFFTAKDIGNIVRLNRNSGRKVYFNRENREYVFDLYDGIKKIRSDDIIQFDGPNSLRVTYFDESKKKRRLELGFVSRNIILDLRSKKRR